MTPQHDPRRFGNAGDTGDRPLRQTTAREEMAAYDSLPPALRRMLSIMPMDVTAVSIAEGWLVVGEHRTLEVLRRHYHLMLAEYRRIIADGCAGPPEE